MLHSVLRRAVCSLMHYLVQLCDFIFLFAPMKQHEVA